jgi:hypothetical protein
MPNRAMTAGTLPCTPISLVPTLGVYQAAQQLQLQLHLAQASSPAEPTSTRGHVTRIFRTRTLNGRARRLEGVTRRSSVRPRSAQLWRLRVVPPNTSRAFRPGPGGTSPRRCVPVSRRERWMVCLGRSYERGVARGDDAAPTHLAQPAEPTMVALSPELIHNSIHRNFHKVIHRHSSSRTGQEA